MLAKLEVNLDSIFGRLRDAQHGDVDLFSINHLHANARRVQEQITQVKDALAILENKIEEKRNELVVARQAEETLKTLKVKENERYNLTIARMENKMQDDVYISQAFRSKQ